MKINFDNIEINGCGTGIEVAHGSNAELKGNMRIIDCEKAIVERDPPSALEALGLPPNTPTIYVKELLEALAGVPPSDIVSKEKIVKESRLWKFIANASNSMTVLQGFISIGSAVLAGLSTMF